jgi:hypothetical protein
MQLVLSVIVSTILGLFVKVIPRVELGALRGLLTGSGTVAYDIAGSNNLSGV